MWNALRFLLIGCGVLSFSGCGGAQAPASHTEGHGRDQRITGSVVEALAEVHAGQYLEDCDKRIADQQREIARALDDRAEAITRYVMSLPPSEDWENRVLGPTLVRHFIGESRPLSGWQSEIMDWRKIIADHARIRELKVGREWAALDSAVRGILVDDLNRTNGSKNELLNRHHGPVLERSVKILKDCLQKTECRPEFPDDLRNFMRDNYYYASTLKRADEAASPTEARPSLEKLLKGLESDSTYYEHRSERVLKRISADRLQIELDPGPFAGARKELAAIIENVWRSSRIAIDIVWKHSTPAHPLYHFALGENPGERAFVRYSEKLIQLHPKTRAKTIAHEFGHVLGFPDRYYTTWNPEQCNYTLEYNEEDLMSDSHLGSVTADDWRTLDEKYPVR